MARLGRSYDSTADFGKSTASLPSDIKPGETATGARSALSDRPPGEQSYSVECTRNSLSLSLFHRDTVSQMVMQIPQALELQLAPKMEGAYKPEHA